MERYKSIYESSTEELIGYLKGKYKTIAQVKSCGKFDKLKDTDKEYIIDELKADGWK